MNFLCGFHPEQSRRILFFKKKKEEESETDETGNDSKIKEAIIVLYFLSAGVAGGDRITMRDEDVSHSGFMG